MKTITRQILESQLATTTIILILSYAFYNDLPFFGTWWAFILGSVGAAILLTVWSTKKLKRGLIPLRDKVQHYVDGDFEQKNLQSPYVEYKTLEEALTAMGEKLHEKIETILNQKQELNAVLESMVQGIIAIDTQERILNINHAALDLFGIQEPPTGSASVQEVIRNPDFQNMVSQVLSSDHSIEGDVTLHGELEKILQVHAAPLRDADGEAIGALLVSYDITKLRKLETLRSDFVANVSHELKTPITSIKGFVETLMDGAIDNPQDARRFIEIVGRQSERLSDIIDDLLSLSRLEQDDESDPVSVESVLVKDIIERALQACEQGAKEKDIKPEVMCDVTLEVLGNAHLLEQALVNLMTNAIKYSDQDQEIRIKAGLRGDEIRISVQDFGAGIPKVHLPRLFERFYRVDKARSRSLGGTGLGLAIVKHIAQVHKGFVNVESTVGKGSTFTLHLPQRNMV